MAKRKKKTTNSALRQAQLEAKVQYGPEKSNLASLLKQARSDLKTSVKGSAGAASGIMAAADAARPEVTKAYQDSGRSLSQANRDLSSDLNALGAAADPYKAVSQREFTGAQTRLSEAMAGALTELQARKVGAQDARAFGTRQAIGQYQKDVGKVNERKKQIAGEQGALTSATYEKLVAAQREADQKQRNTDRSYALQTASLAETARGHDLSAASSAASRAQSAQNARKSRALTRRGQDLSSGGKGGKKLSPSETRQRQNQSTGVLNQITEARTWLKRLKDVPSSQVRGLLLTGHKTASGTTIPKYPRVVVNTAFDLEKRGGVSAPNRAELGRQYVQPPKTWGAPRPTPHLGRGPFKASGSFSIG